MKTKLLTLLVVLVVAIFGCPLGGAGFVRAQTADDAALIAQLQAQIVQLQAQINALLAQKSTAANQTLCNNSINTNLGFAQSGTDAVGVLHKILSAENISFGSDSGDTYTIDTANAVKKFQAKYGIPQTGYVGNLTMAKMNAMINTLFGCIPTTAISQAAATTTTPVPTIATTPATTPTPTPIPNSMVPGSPLAVTCTGAPDPTTDKKINWTAAVSGGTENYTYQWSDNNGHVYNNFTQSFPLSYDYDGLKFATITINDGKTSVEAICSSMSTAVPQPQIILTSPKGGDHWYKGQTYQITWQETNYDGPVLITLFDYTPGSRYGTQYPITPDLMHGPITGGSFSWTIPSTTPDGDFYRLLVDASTSSAQGTNAQSMNLDYFWITSGVANCVPNWSCQWSSCSGGYQTGTPVDSNNCLINPSVAAQNGQTIPDCSIKQCTAADSTNNATGTSTNTGNTNTAPNTTNNTGTINGNNQNLIDDLNGDGVVNQDDQMLLINCVAKSPGYKCDKADLNHDGVVDDNDITTFFQYYYSE